MVGSKPKRATRVAERIRSELMDLLLRGVVRDPAAGGSYITGARVSDDLRHARLYVRLGDFEADAGRRREAVAALNRAAGFLRRELSPRLKLKYMPELEFFWDEGVDQAARIEELLREVGGGEEEGTP